MANLNRVHLMGRVTKDLELRYTPKGTAIANLGLAVNRVWSEDGEKRQETTFVDVTLWGRVAEVASQYLKKGRSVFVEGRLQLKSWDDKQTGQKRSRLIVLGENLQFLSDRTGIGPEHSQSDAGSAGVRHPHDDPELEREPEDIPF
jgi:single-strand DNA-binding protein